jgi:hypothetical protein
MMAPPIKPSAKPRRQRLASLWLLSQRFRAALWLGNHRKERRSTSSSATKTDSLTFSFFYGSHNTMETTMVEEDTSSEEDEAVDSSFADEERHAIKQNSDNDSKSETKVWCALCVRSIGCYGPGSIANNAPRVVVYLNTHTFCVCFLLLQGIDAGSLHGIFAPPQRQEASGPARHLLAH